MYLCCDLLALSYDFYTMAKLKEGFKGERFVSLPEKLLEEYAQDPLIGNLYLRMIGYFPHVKYHYVHKEQGCDYCMLIYCIHGKGWYETDGKRYIVKENEYIFIPDHTPYTFGADSSFTCQLKDRVISGTVSKEEESEQFVLHYQAVEGLLNIGSVKVFIRKSGDALSIMYEADKLLEILTAIASVTQNTTLNTIGQLAEGYDGLLVGYELVQ